LRQGGGIGIQELERAGTRGGDGLRPRPGAARGFQDQLQAMLRHARSLAVAQQRDVCVLLDAVQARMVYTTAALCDAASPVAEPGSRTPFVAAVPNGVALAGVTQVRFNPQGQPVPNVNQIVTVSARVLTISRETGTVFYP
jgi:Tfp pilus assembly protein FimT